MRLEARPAEGVQAGQDVQAPRRRPGAAAARGRRGRLRGRRRGGRAGGERRGRAAHLLAQQADLEVGLGERSHLQAGRREGGVRRGGGRAAHSAERIEDAVEATPGPPRQGGHAPPLRSKRASAQVTKSAVECGPAAPGEGGELVPTSLACVAFFFLLPPAKRMESPGGRGERTEVAAAAAAPVPARDAGRPAA